MEEDHLEKALITLSKQMLNIESELRQLKAGLTVLKSTLAMKMRPRDPKAFLAELRALESKLLGTVDKEGAEARKRAHELFDLLLRDDVNFGDPDA
jgi:hypothetical protein